MKRKTQIFFVFILTAAILVSVRLTVFSQSRVSISDKKLALYVGETKKLTLKNTGRKQKVTWKSSKKRVAAVNKSGKVTGKKVGSAVIQAKMGNKTYSCKVTVYNKPMAEKITVTAGGQTFTIKMSKSKAAEEFVSMLPLTVTMDELNGNEKYYYMDGTLTSQAGKAYSIHTGDFMLYGSDCLVLFYEDFKTSYSYTRLGSVEDTEGFREALGSQSVKAEFRRYDE